MQSTLIENIQHHLQTKTFWCIYKHSNTCLTSTKAYKQIQAAQQDQPSLPVIFVSVQEHSDVSQRIEEYFEIKHESPQCILFKGKKIKKVMNHFSITQAQIIHYIKGGRNK